MFGRQVTASSPCRSWLADFERIHPERLGDVLELRRAEIGDRKIEPSLTCRYASSERQIAPGLATPCNRAAILTPSPIRSPSLSSTTSPKWMPTRNFDAPVRRDPSIALDHRPLDFNGAVYCVDNTPELGNCAIAGALDDPAVVDGDGRVDQIAA